MVIPRHDANVRQHVKRNPRKRPIEIKRDLYQSKETYINEKRPMEIKREQQRQLKRMGKTRHGTGVRQKCQKRPISIKRHLYQSKETYINHKRTTTAAQEAGYSVAKMHRMPYLQVSFRKRAINYRALLRKETYEDTASYASLPPCDLRHDTDVYQTRQQRETDWNRKRPLSIKRNLFDLKKPYHQSKKTYNSGSTGWVTCETTLMYTKYAKRDLQKRSVQTKRDLYQLKETYYQSKETYSRSTGWVTCDTTLIWTKYIETDPQKSTNLCLAKIWRLVVTLW